MTNPTTDTAGREDRFGKLIERADGADVPFYDGQPVQVAGWKWLVMVLAAAAGFLALALIPATGNLQLLGTRILSDLRPAGGGVYKGRAFEPKRNIRGSATVRQVGPNVMVVKGCAVLGVLCKEQRWTRIS